jgi:hypothetical protein
MEEELIAQRLLNLEREIIALRQHLTEIKGMLAGLSGSIDSRIAVTYTPPKGKTIGEYFGSIMPD